MPDHLPLDPYELEKILLVKRGGLNLVIKIVTQCKHILNDIREHKSKIHELAPSRRQVAIKPVN
jgi:hypothetical protein